MIYIHSPASLRHDPRALSPDHPDNPSRLVAIEAALDAAALDDLDRHEAPAACPSDLWRVHSREHVAFVRNLCCSGGGQIDQDTYVGEASYAAALHAAGGACELTRMLMGGVSDTGFCALRPAGHHADRDRAMGFCLFNNTATAAELAIADLGAQRVMIIDWDVHHGNGTAEIFRHRPDVLFCDIHQAGLFPGTGVLGDGGSGPGRGYTVNLPVPAGSDEEVWLSLLEHLIVPIGLEYRPNLVLISAGFDAHAADPLADCRLESSSFGRMACHVRELGAALAAPVGAILEGGYDPVALAESTVATISALQGRGAADSAAPDPLVTPHFASHLGHRWTL
jgi:acetoin utilization deacetylase AcuC-like enzyme